MIYMEYKGINIAPPKPDGLLDHVGGDFLTRLTMDI